MSYKRVAAAAALTALIPFLSACGGDDSENAAEPLPTAPTLTVPGDEKTPEVEPAKTDTETTETGTETATTPATPTQTTPAPSNPGTAQGGAAAPQTGGAAPDSPQNDQQPPADSPASKFEQFCKENPGAC